MRTEKRESHKKRLEDAKEFLESALDNLSKSRFKAAVVDAGDTSIAANDAFTIFMIQEKASSDHREAILLHKKAGQKISENKANSLKELLDLRHTMGYRPVDVTGGAARAAVIKAERFLAWVSVRTG